MDAILVRIQIRNLLLIATVFALSYLPTLTFLGRWDKLGEFSRYLGLVVPLIVYPFIPKLDHHEDKRSVQILAAILFVLCAFFFNQNVPYHQPFLFNRSETDIGQSTEDSVKAFMRGQNPYTTAITYDYGLGPRYGGYKYGPGMILGYLPLAFLPDWGLKIVNFTYLLIFLGCCIVLLKRDAEEKTFHLRNGLLIVSCILSMPILWVELFKRGVVEIVPVCFLALALLSIKKGALKLAGFFLALSTACKPVIGFAALLAFVVQYPSIQSAIGITLGSLPGIIFAFLNWSALYRNAIDFHLQKSTNHNTVFNYLSSNLQIGLSIIIAICFFISIVHKRIEKNWERLLYTSACVLVTGMVLFRHINNNHSLWIFPLVPLLLTAKILPYENNRH